MSYRHHNPIVLRAVIWLMAALFMLPASFSTACPCLDTLQHLDCDCDGCPSQSQQIETSYFSSSHVLSSQQPICPCTNDCPCRCSHGSPQPIHSAVNRLDSQDDLESIAIQTEPIWFIGLDSCPAASSCPFSIAAPSALQRCISLSRFTL